MLFNSTDYLNLVADHLHSNLLEKVGQFYLDGSIFKFLSCTQSIFKKMTVCTIFSLLYPLYSPIQIVRKIQGNDK